MRTKDTCFCGREDIKGWIANMYLCTYHDRLYRKFRRMFERDVEKYKVKIVGDRRSDRGE